MGVVSEAAAQRARIRAAQDELERRLRLSYDTHRTPAWHAIQGFLSQYQAAQDAGEVSASWLYEQRRMAALLTQIERAVAQYGAASLDMATIAQQRMIAAGAQDAYELLAASFGNSAITLGQLGLSFFRLPREAMERMEGLAGNGQPLADLFATFGPEAAAKAKADLLLGVGVGQAPDQVARALSADLDISRNRATVIARTETMRAYREAASDTYRANSDVLGGWVWLASPTACAACLFMEGSVHDLDEDMDSHAQCRCTQVPLTRSWGDILDDVDLDDLQDVDWSDLPDTSVDVPTGEQVFNDMSEAQQVSVLGKAGYNAYQAGDVSLSDFADYQFDKEWGRSLYQPSLKELGLDASDYLPAAAESDVAPAVARARGLADEVEGYQVIRRTDDGLMLLRTPVGDVWMEQDASREELVSLTDLDPARAERWNGIEDTLRSLRGDDNFAGDAIREAAHSEPEQAPISGLLTDHSDPTPARASRYEPQESVRAIERWLGKEYPKLEAVSLEGLPLDVANRIAGEYVRLADEYPEGAGRLRFLFTKSGSFGQYAAGKFANIADMFTKPWFMGADFRSGLFLYLNDEMLAEPGLDALLAAEARAGFIADGTGSVEGLVAHEWGHLIEAWFRSSAIGARNVDALEAVAFAGSDISAYARTLAIEQWAEAFAALQYGSGAVRESDYVRALQKFLDGGVPFMRQT